LAINHSTKSDIAFSALARRFPNMFRLPASPDAIAIDKSSAFRMDPHVPLVIPEINAEDVMQNPESLRTPNCTTLSC